MDQPRSETVFNKEMNCSAFFLIQEIYNKLSN